MSVKLCYLNFMNMVSFLIYDTVVSVIVYACFNRCLIVAKGYKSFEYYSYSWTRLDYVLMDKNENIKKLFIH